MFVPLRDVNIKEERQGNVYILCVHVCVCVCVCVLSIHHNKTVITAHMYEGGNLRFSKCASKEQVRVLT